MPQSIEFLLPGLLFPRTDQDLTQLPVRASPSQSWISTQTGFSIPNWISTRPSSLPIFAPLSPCFGYLFQGKKKSHSKLKSDAPAAFWCLWLLQFRVRRVSKEPEDSQCLIPVARPPTTQPRSVLRACCRFFLLLLILLLCLFWHKPPLFYFLALLRILVKV